MDSKRPDKYRTVKQLVALLCIALLASCTWVKDDTDDCPNDRPSDLKGFWLNLHYTYNILDVEAVQKYVKDATVYVYDAAGNYVKRIDVPEATLAANSHRVKVEGLTEGDYRFVVWSGIGNSEYAIADDQAGMDDFRLSLAGGQQESAVKLPDLYYGSLETVHYDDKYASHDVYLMKNTNQLACLVVSISSDTKLEVEDYDMSIVTANGAMDVNNKLVADTETTYMPFSQKAAVVDDSEYGTLNGIQFDISTLRLMEDTDSRLIFQKKDSETPVFNISFPQFIGMVGSLYTNLGRPLTVQEYLDRQDFYTIVFFLSEDANTLLQLKVNSWRLRAYNHLKL